MAAVIAASGKADAGAAEVANTVLGAATSDVRDSHDGAATLIGEWASANRGSSSCTLKEPPTWYPRCRDRLRRETEVSDVDLREGHIMRSEKNRRRKREKILTCCTCYVIA